MIVVSYTESATQYEVLGRGMVTDRVRTDARTRLMGAAGWLTTRQVDA